MNVIGEIISWSERLPDWQSDALRRIWTKGQLSRDDEVRALKLLLLQHDLLLQEDVGFSAERFAASHVGSGTVHGQDTVLKALHDVKNVNALREGQRLEFGESGVTVVYGDNATGKSGYSRVLKRACKARGVAERIYPNVYSGGKSTPGPAEASFDVAIENSGDQTVIWKDGSPSPGSLTNIAVFDSKVARVQVDEANEVAYVPYGLDVFTKLATLCQILREEIQNKIVALPKVPASVAEFVGDGKPIPVINAETDPQIIITVTNFSADDQTKLEHLSKTIADYGANDPVKKAKGFRRLKERIDRLRGAIVKLKQTLSDSAVAQSRKLHDNLAEAQKAADLASKGAFSLEPLSGAGGNAWKMMFEAAQHYSEQDAYPNQKFPVVGNGSRCVLCQQELGADAKDRLSRFWQFVEEDVAKNVITRRGRLELARKQLQQIEANPLKSDPQLIEEVRELSKSCAAELEPFFASVELRIRALDKAMSAGSWVAIPKLAVYASQGLSKLSKQCEKDAKDADALGKPEEQGRSEKELILLTLRKKLGENRQTLLDYLEMLKTKRKLEQCLESVNPYGITRKQRELMELALTKDLETALEREFDALGIAHLHLKVTKTGNIGRTLHKLALSDAALEPKGLSEVLSEGEYRVVAIASFLAELSTASHKCGIIFDDPVSSLDQHWRERVARRLTDEGNKRQVVIFTHDIVFLVALQEQADELQVPLKVQMVTRTKDEVGICDPQLTTPIMKTGKRISTLKQKYQTLKASHKRDTEEEFRHKVMQFYGFLRKSWERAVEECLLNDVVYRFRLGVETQRLKEVMVEDQDFVDVSNGISRCSKWIEGHDQAGALGNSVPQPDEIERDLELLQEFCTRVKDRSSAAENRRKAKLAAPSIEPKQKT